MLLIFEPCSVGLVEEEVVVLYNIVCGSDDIHRIVGVFGVIFAVDSFDLRECFGPEFALEIIFNLFVGRHIVEIVGDILTADSLEHCTTGLDYQVVCNLAVAGICERETVTCTVVYKVSVEVSAETVHICGETLNTYDVKGGLKACVCYYIVTEYSSVRISVSGYCGTVAEELAGVMNVVVFNSVER